MFGAIAVTQPARVRLVAAVALGCGFLLAAAAATLSRWVTVESIHFHVEPGSRYTTLPIFLMEAAVIVAVDNVVRQARERARPDEQAAAFGVAPWAGLARARGATAAAAALVLALSFAWVTDFRSDNGRAGGALWAPVAAGWLTACQRDPGGAVTAPTAAVDDPELDRHPVRAPAALTVLRMLRMLKVLTKSKGVLAASALALGRRGRFGVGRAGRVDGAAEHRRRQRGRRQHQLQDHRESVSFPT